MAKLQVSVTNAVFRVHRTLHVQGPEDGQTLAEYALILALIAVVAVLALIYLGGTITKLFSNTGNKI